MDMEEEGVPPLEDVTDRTAQKGGMDWKVRLNGTLVFEHTMQRSDFASLLQAMRAGAVTLETDPVLIAAEPLPGSLEGLATEWELIDAMLVGGRAHGSLTKSQLDALERRMTSMTEALREEGEGGDGNIGNAS